MVDTVGSLSFLDRASVPYGQRPYELVFQPKERDFPTSNFKTETVHNVPMYDMRPLRANLSLDRQGFMVMDLDTKLTYDDYFDPEKLRSIYLPEVKNLLRRELGARATYIHECVIRRSQSKAVQIGESFGQPIPNAHTDYTNDYALSLVDQLVGDSSQAAAIKKSRLQMLNLWKPLKGPLKRWPLAVCDLQTANRHDLVELDEVHEAAVLNSQQIVYSPSQQWYYLSRQLSTEILVFKSMDSVIHGEVPHGAFSDPLCPDTEPERESIELRVLVVY